MFVNVVTIFVQITFTLTLSNLIKAEYINNLFTSSMGSALLPYYYYANDIMFLFGSDSVKKNMATHITLYFGIPFATVFTSFVMVYIPSLFTSYSYADVIEW